MRNFIEGTFELDHDVIDLISYEDAHEKALKQIIEWGDDEGIVIVFGTSDDNTYLCQYQTICNTSAMCKGLVAELKHMLKSEFKKTKSILQYSGTCL